MEFSGEMDASEELFHACNESFMESEAQGIEAWPFKQPIPMPYLENTKRYRVAKRFASGHIKSKEEIKDVIRTYVLPFLPAKALLRFKAVSKEWDRLISSPLFPHQQSFSFQKISGYFSHAGFGCPKFLSLDNSAYGVACPNLSFMPENRKVLCSTNGLLLCQCSESYYVCNPTTKDFRLLPDPSYYHGTEPAVVLAFEPSLRNIEAYYHVVCAFAMIDSPIIYFEIYSRERNSWKFSEAICAELGDASLTGAGFYMNGNAYWETSTGQLLAFNIHSEESGVISLPPDVSSYAGTFTNVGGEVCYVTAQNHCDNVVAIEIYGGLDMSLKRSIFLNLELSDDLPQPVCKVLPGVDGDKLLILSEGSGLVLHCYHFSDQKLEVLCKPSYEFNFYSRFLPYINSLAYVA